MTVKITNLSRNTFTTSLYHDKYCEKGAECGCTEKRLVRSVPKGSGMTYIHKKLAASLRIAAGETFCGLHDAIMELPHIEAALQTKPPLLKVVKESPKKAVVAVKPEPFIADAPILSDDSIISNAKGRGADVKPARKNRGRRSFKGDSK
jgi:hypothetical protein